MNRPYMFSLLISSPSDVKIEREIIDKACSEWNRVNYSSRNIFVNPLRWERNVPAQTTNKNPQSHINNHLLTVADIVFGLFWMKCGSPTETHESGTIEEIEEGIKKNLLTTVYFITKSVSPNDVDPQQLEKIKAFKEKYKSRGIYKDIASSEDLMAEFQFDLENHIKTLMKKFESNKKEENVITLSESEAEEKADSDYWYERSISELINHYLREEKVGVFYTKKITFNENCYLWKSNSSINHEASVEVAKKAREYAFNIKYGNYNYEGDLRRKYPDWYKSILYIFGELGFDIKGKRVIGVGANNGNELNEIFRSNGYSSIDVLDLSKTAIENGRKKYNHIQFHQGNMEVSPLENDTYDIYFNLRSIHSSGVDYKQALADCFRILKKDGVAIISIANGYLAPNKPGSKEMFEVPGLYDSETQTFSPDRPFILASKIRSKLQDFGFKKASILTGKTEIFIYVKK